MESINTHLIILPGWGGTKESWQGFVDIAQPFFASIEVIELPCFGNEPCPTEVWGVEQYANFVGDRLLRTTDYGLFRTTDYRLQTTDDGLQTTVDRRLSTVDQHVDQQVVILGHSFGGQVLAHLVAHNPDICDKVIFAAASIVRENFLIKRTALGLTAKIGKGIFMIPGFKQFSGIARKILYRVSDSPDYQKTSGIQRDIYKKIIREDQTKCLDAILIPSLVVWGDKDRLTPLKYGTMIAKRLKNAELAVIPNAKHGLHHETKQELLQIINNFLNKTKSN